MDCPQDIKSTSERMQRDWDARARENAFYYVASSNENWTPEEFYASGAESVQTTVLDDLERITQGKDPKQMHMLEIGCGAGRMSVHLAQAFAQVHAVDVSGEMVRLAQQALEPHPNATAYQNNGQDLSALGDVQLDFAFSFIVFQHIPDRAVVESYVADVARLLRPGGVFKFQVQGHWRRPEEGFDTWIGQPVSGSDLMRWAEAYGFELLDFSGVGTQYCWVWFRKTEPSRTRQDAAKVAGLFQAENAHLSDQAGRLSAELAGYQSAYEQLSSSEASTLDNPLKVPPTTASPADPLAADRLQREVEERTAWAERLDAELEQHRTHLQAVYGSLAYRVGRRLGLAPDPIGAGKPNGKR